MASNTTKIVVAATVAVVVGMLFLQPVLTSVNDNTGTQTVTNETVSADVGAYVNLGGYDINSGSETVWGYNDSSGSYEQATAGTDYELDEGGGELKVLNSSTLIQDGEDVKVSYEYQASGQTTALVAGFIPTMVVLLLFVLVAMEVTDIL